MRTTIDFGEGKELELECSAFTPIVFSESFSVEKPDGGHRPKDLTEAIAEITDRIAESGVPPMSPLLEVLYACAKSADLKIPGFRKWLESLPDDALDLSREDGWAKEVIDLITQQFFRSSAMETEADRSDDTADSGGN